MQEGDIRYTAYWYGKDAIDNECDEIIPDAISFEHFSSERLAISAAKRNAFQSGVAGWCQVLREVCTNTKYNWWDDVVTTTYSRNNNRWSVDHVEQHT